MRFCTRNPLLILLQTKTDKKSTKKPKLDALSGANLFEEEKGATGASSDKENSDAGGSQDAGSDYDVDEEYDNDYAENYFDNGEGDDMDDLGDGVGGNGGGESFFPILFTKGI